MSSQSLFHFKQFSIAQDQTAMKIGLDGVLLGAWAELSFAQQILDIGTGTGLIALMAAQRQALAKIDAIEIEADAFEQAKKNFEQNPWPDRITAYHCSLQNWVQTSKEAQYDVIVSNPPYFEIEKSSFISDRKRRIARSTSMLSYDELLASVGFLLKNEGSFSLILPFIQSSSFLDKISNHNLYVHKLEYLSPRKGKAATRCLIQLKKYPTTAPQMEEWAIRNSGQNYHDYTDHFLNLTKPFYLFIK